jgi:hypothetical protein
MITDPAAADRFVNAVIAHITERPSERPSLSNDRYLDEELNDIALALDQMANELADDGSPLTECADKTAARVRGLLAYVREGKRV